jgi:hypothetical protein
VRELEQISGYDKCSVQCTLPKTLPVMIHPMGAKGSMPTEGLHCRLLASTQGDFDTVVKAAQQFGKPITKFEQTASIIAWNERLSFETGDWSWVSGLPATEITLRIAVFHLGTIHTVVRSPTTLGTVREVPTNVGVFGIVSGFSSVSNAGRSYISRVAFGSNQVSLSADLGQIITDPGLQSALVGYSYIADGIFHAVSTGLRPGGIQATKVTSPPFASNIVSVQFKVTNAIIALNQNTDLSISVEAGDPDYAVEDTRSIFQLIRERHLSVNPQF